MVVTYNWREGSRVYSELFLIRMYLYIFFKNKPILSKLCMYYTHTHTLLISQQEITNNGQKLQKYLVN